ncbi:hypothetical protein [Synechocystis sp. PCC 6714]|uniref:hypothetical protein n=1 Tax=Synechocystis sp. (strain PCC 6714) TaxID=1147 RepID=UPI00040FE4C9|nr:hypothetical protein [Synechocystis sp. PCC 6714]AIE76299.1 hypothetical protein D082_60200 [Synechocystis sp. PCC 6714]
MDIKQLCDRYALTSRQALYDRLKALGITLSRQGRSSYATPEQVELLDQIHQHLAEGGSLKTFTPIAETTVSFEPVNPALDKSLDIVKSRLDNSPDTVRSELDIMDSGLDINPQTIALLNLMQSFNRRSPLDKHRELEEAAAHNWILTTSEIEELLGVKPKGETFTRGCWIFRRSGKIGNQSAWIVEKI